MLLILVLLTLLLESINPLRLVSLVPLAHTERKRFLFHLLQGCIIRRALIPGALDLLLAMFQSRRPVQETSPYFRLRLYLPDHFTHTLLALITPGRLPRQRIAIPLDRNTPRLLRHLHPLQSYMPLRHIYPLSVLGRLASVHLDIQIYSLSLNRS